MRVNAYIADELAARARAKGLSWSTVLQEALEARLGCRHTELACITCAAPVAAESLRLEGAERYWWALAGVLDELAARAASSSGIARLIHHHAADYGITAARAYRAARPTRAALEEAGRSKNCA